MFQLTTNNNINKFSLLTAYRLPPPTKTGGNAIAAVDFEVVRADSPVFPVRDRIAHHRPSLRPAEAVQRPGLCLSINSIIVGKFHVLLFFIYFLLLLIVQAFLLATVFYFKKPLCVVLNGVQCALLSQIV